MKIGIGKTLVFGVAALGLVTLPSFAMAAGGDMRDGGGHMDRDRGGQMGGGHMGGGHMGGERMGGERMGGAGRGGSGRRFAGADNRGVSEFRERIRERHSGYGDRDRGFREPVRERSFRAPARERIRVSQRVGVEQEYGTRRLGYGYGAGRIGYGGYGFRRPVAYGFGYGRPRGRLVKVCTVRFVPFR